MSRTRADAVDSRPVRPGSDTGVSELLAAVMSAAAAREWMTQPNASLRGNTPERVITSGREAEVKALLLALAEGVIS